MDKKDVYVFATAIGGLIKAMGMQAENTKRLSNGESIAYNDDSFNQLMVDRGLHHNSLMTELYP